jgi:hypothetical protein
MSRPKRARSAANNARPPSPSAQQSCIVGPGLHSRSAAAYRDRSETCAHHGSAVALEHKPPMISLGSRGVTPQSLPQVSAFDENGASVRQQYASGRPAFPAHENAASAVGARTAATSTGMANGARNMLARAADGAQKHGRWSYSQDGGRAKAKMNAASARAVSYSDRRRRRRRSANYSQTTGS